MNLINDHGFILMTVVISINGGLLSGIYPALILSSQTLLTLFKGQMSTKGLKKLSLKNILVSSQFSISIFLILITLSFSLQIRYHSRKNLGLDKENILSTRMSVSNQEITFDQLRSRILQHPEISDAMMTKIFLLSVSEVA
jgi:putative ABC transport system permease protein